MGGGILGLVVTGGAAAPSEELVPRWEALSFSLPSILLALSGFSKPTG